MSGWAIVLGMASGLGVLLVLMWGQERRLGLEARVSSRLRPQDDHAGFGTPGTREGLGGVVSVVVRDVARVVSRWGSTTAEIGIRLERAGSPLTAAQYRVEQVVWGMAGGLVGVVMAGFLLSRGASPASLVVMVGLCGLSGGALREYALSRAIRVRGARMVSELPTIADILALAVSAGEGASAALERISRVGSGVLAEEFRRIVGEVRTGTPLSVSLHSLAERTGVAALSRFALGIAIAVERGTPLVEVLHAQALDVREAGRRKLIEEGGRREIAMMVPVIFLLLPVTVVFAVFPGIIAIRFGA